MNKTSKTDNKDNKAKNKETTNIKTQLVSNLKEYESQCKEDCISKVKKNIFSSTKSSKDIADLTITKENLIMQIKALSSKYDELNRQEAELDSECTKEINDDTDHIEDSTNSVLLEIHALRSEVSNCD